MADKYVLVNAGSSVRKIISTRFIVEVMELQGRTSLKTTDGSTYIMTRDIESYVAFLSGGLSVLDAS